MGTAVREMRLREWAVRPPRIGERAYQGIIEALGAKDDPVRDQLCVRHLTALTAAQLRAAKGFGPRSLARVEAKLAQDGLALKRPAASAPTPPSDSAGT